MVFFLFLQKKKIVLKSEIQKFLGGEEGNFFAMDNQIFVTWIQSYAFAVSCKVLYLF